MIVTPAATDTEARLQRFIGTTLMDSRDPRPLGLDEALLSHGILDSLGIMRLAVFIEEDFGVSMPDEAFVPEHFRTVKDLAAFVDRLPAAQCNGAPY